MAELKVVEEAIQLATSLGAIRVITEADAQLVMFATKDDFSSAATILQGLKLQCQTWFSRCSVIYCTSRSVNGAAHELAKIGALGNPGFMNVWESNTPANVAVLVTGDLPNYVS